MTDADKLRHLVESHDLWYGGRDEGAQSALWNRAYEACDADRGDMWYWLEDKFIAWARLAVKMIEVLDMIEDNRGDEDRDCPICCSQSWQQHTTTCQLSQVLIAFTALSKRLP